MAHVVADTNLSAAVDATEELEANAKLFLLIFQDKFQTVTPENIAGIRRLYLLK